jgi:DNA replication protein DnaC
VLVGPNAVGKTMSAKNLAHEAILAGRTVRFTSASVMLQDLAAQDGARALQRALRRYSSPTLLVVDELGYLSYDHRHADLLFEVVNRRYEAERSILVTTNKPFAEWGEVFPSATCVVTLVDRLVHRSEIIGIDADSFRLREAEERHQRKSR